MITKTAEHIQKVGANSFTLWKGSVLVVVGLFWQSAIKNMINSLVPLQNSWVYEVVLAVVLTILCVGLIYYIESKHKKEVE